MEKYEIEKLRLPCEGVAQRLGLTVKHHKAICPFHDDHTPSLTFKGSKWKCWSCGESGDSISLVMKVLGKNFLDACRWLADEHNVIIDHSPFLRPDGSKRPSAERTIDHYSGMQKPFDASRYERFFERPWFSAEARKFLFDERRIDPRVVRWCRVSSWKDRDGVNWLQIPYFNQEGKLMGVQNRNLMKGARPRFKFAMGFAPPIYNLPVLKMLSTGDVLWIAEGCSDCWAMLSAGHKAIAIPSATLLNKKDVEILQSLSSELSVHFEMWPDNDEPGERLFLQLQQVLPSLVHHHLPPGCKDFSEYYLSTLVDGQTV